MSNAPALRSSLTLMQVPEQLNEALQRLRGYNERLTNVVTQMQGTTAVPATAQAMPAESPNGLVEDIDFHLDCIENQLQLMAGKVEAIERQFHCATPVPMQPLQQL